MSRLRIHLIANAHIDPVWLWDWREGLNEGLLTCKAMLDLMDEDPDFTFIRGEAAMYRHIQRADPAMFRRIARRVAEGRWDVVGGTWIQADTNLAATETYVRQYAQGQRWFREAFGKTARVAWAADSFGHGAGLPEAMSAAGIRAFAFSRPDEKTLPLPLPAFWWEGPAGSRILCYRTLTVWYCSERHGVPEKLDTIVERSAALPLGHAALFYGMGNHGGGASRRHLDEIRAWAARHPEVEVVHSGLHRLFDELAEDVKRKRIELPVHRGEMNFCLRGCYASVAKFKWPYRRAEARLAASEALDALSAGAAGEKPAALDEPWQGVLFNAFHDVLPGSAIERAFDDQIAWLGAIVHRCQRLDLDSINRLAARIDTAVPPAEGDRPTAIPFLVWNPHPHPFVGHVELEGSLDYRPIWAYAGKPEQLPVEVRGPDGAPLPHQAVATEHRSMVDLAWRRRVVVPVTLPPLGWQVFTMGWVEGARVPAVPDAASADASSIANSRYRVRATVGADGVEILRDGEPLFAGKLGAVLVDDPWGSWGGMNEEPESLDPKQVRERWRVTAVALRERGPERAALWVRLAGAKSRLDLTFQLYRGREAVDIELRAFIDERSARLRLVMPGATSAEYEVPGGSATRGEVGEVPALRWARVTGGDGGFGFASDALSSFVVRDGAFMPTVARATRYADDVVTGADERPWLPAVDAGELRCRLLLADADERLPILARELAQPPQAQTVSATAAIGKQPLPRSGSFGELRPASLALLALKGADDGEGLVLRAQEISGEDARATLTWAGRMLALGTVRGGAIASWRLRRARAGWTAERCDALEDPTSAKARPAAKAKPAAKTTKARARA